MLRTCGSARGRTHPSDRHGRLRTGPGAVPWLEGRAVAREVWATTWEDEANAEIAPRIGLPTLPVVNWPESSDEHDREDQWFGLFWKTRTLVDWADGRPFAWVDDEITDADRNWVSAHHRGRASCRSRSGR